MLKDVYYVITLNPVTLAVTLLLGLAFLYFTVLLTLRSYRLHASTGVESLIGAQGKIVEWKGMQGRVHIHGEIWQARSEETLSVKKTIKSELPTSRTLFWWCGWKSKNIAVIPAKAGIS